MDINLRLLPCERWGVKDGRLWGFSQTILELGDVVLDARNAFSAQVEPHLVDLPSGHEVASLVGALVPDGHCAGELMYGTVRDKDTYGEVYKAVAAQHLLPWLESYFGYDGSHGCGPYQTAAVAFVRALPPETRIILDWR